MITATWLLAPWAMLWVALIRALLERAEILPPTCRRCGLPVGGDPSGVTCACFRQRS